MDFLTFIQSLVLGIVEGLTEFLPVSSTGHLILAGDLMGFEKPWSETFYIAIQAGAIVAVCWHYRMRLLAVLLNLFKRGPEQRLAVNIVVGFLPAAVLGAALSGFVKSHFFNVFTVAVALVAGGLLILWIEAYHKKRGIEPRIREVDDMRAVDAFAVGCMQCFALIPGTSRSGSTIIGGLILGLSRKAATEFSFFLAIPTIFGATVWDLWQSRDALSLDSLPAITVGFVVSFVSAIVVVRWLLRYVSTNDFKAFGWYRIVFGIVVLAAGYLGVMTL